MSILKFPSRKPQCPIQTLNDLVRDINAIVAVGTERKRRAESAANLRLATPGGKPRLFDNLVLKIDYRGFRIKIFQTKESVGTASPRYLAMYANLDVKKHVFSRLKGVFREPYDAVTGARHKVDRRREIIDTRPKPKARNLKETTPAKIETPIIEAIVYESDFPIPRRIENAYLEYHHEETDRTVSEFLERVG